MPAAYHLGAQAGPRRWPVGVDLLPDESLTSWLARCAFAHGCAPTALTGVLWPKWRVWTIDADRGIPADHRRALQRCAGVPADAIQAASLETVAVRVAGRRPRDDRAWPWMTAVRSPDRRICVPQFCPRCLAADDPPHYRIDWRLAWHTTCPRHHCALAERCAACGNPQQVHRLAVDARHIGVCAACGTNLGDCVAPAHQEEALRFQEAADNVAMTGTGRCLGNVVGAGEWFVTADFFAGVIRRAARTPSSALTRLLAAVGIEGPLRVPAASGARIERLGRRDRETLLGAVHGFMSMRRSHLEDVIEAAGTSRQTLFGETRKAPRTLATLEAALPDRRRPGGRRAPRARGSGPRPRHEVETMMRRLENRLERAPR